MASSLGQLSYRGSVARNQSLLLCSRPSLQASLRRNRIFDAIELLVEDKFDGKPAGRETAKHAGVVFRHAPLQRAAGRADIIPTVTASQHVNEGPQIPPSPSLCPFGRDHVQADARPGDRKLARILEQPETVDPLDIGESGLSEILR